QPGDRLVLTKPLGTGILATALKRELIGDAEMADAVASMTTLNHGAAVAARTVGDAVHAATDVTGFGLLGHLHNMLVASGVGARVFARAVPVFDRVDEMIEARAVPGGTTRNLDTATTYTEWGDGVSDATRTLLCDAQTSGGLLLCVAAGATQELLDALAHQHTPAVAVIGEIVTDDGARIRVLDADA
ncbi:MAG: selenide, water dikinase SelD, partial [Gemmatimonadales bacterium]